MVNRRLKVTLVLNSRLQQKLEVGLLSGFLELDTTEINDHYIRMYYRNARKVIEDEAITMFTKQLGLFRECTSIVARIAALVSLTSRNSWPILSLTAALPLLDQIFRMLPWMRQDDEDG
jgi:hypothetical protein